MIAIQPLVCGLTFLPETKDGEIVEANIEIDPKAVFEGVPFPLFIISGDRCTHPAAVSYTHQTLPTKA